MEKAMVAMSGGVDSSVAALLVKQMGFEAIGIIMKLYYNEAIGVSREKTCCSLEDVEDARRVAGVLNMPFYVLNFAQRFEDEVISRFVEDYAAGRTPNPCVECNKHIKFDQLLHRAEEIGCAYLSTGHYARIEKDENSGRYLLKKSADRDKDQTYMLYTLSQYQLSKILFPLGGLQKETVRQMARENGLLTAHKRDSQDLCFVPDGDYAGFIRRYTGKEGEPGDFVGTSGEIYGRHKGIVHYTVGQRKGLGLSFPQPMYVGDIDPVRNRVLLVKSQELMTQTLTANEINLISVPEIEKPMEVQAKVRYRHRAEPAVVTQLGKDMLRVEFAAPQRAVTRGQSVVLYDGDVVVGGGKICSPA